MPMKNAMFSTAFPAFDICPPLPNRHFVDTSPPGSYGMPTLTYVAGRADEVIPVADDWVSNSFGFYQRPSPWPR
jgi:hypothetical protein